MDLKIGNRVLLVQRKSGQALQEISWKAVANTGRHSAKRSYESFDILFEPIPALDGTPPPSPGRLEEVEDVQILLISPYGEKTEATAQTLGSQEAFKFLQQCLLSTKTHNGVRLAKLIVPWVAGHIVRSDIVAQRLVDSEFVDAVSSFATPQQFYAGDAIRAEDCFGWLSHLFRKSVAGILVRLDGSSEYDLQPSSRSLEAELDDKLSFPWMVKEIHPRKTLAIIEAGRVHPRYGGTGPAVYGAAKALGLNTIAMDNAGHWMDGPEFEDWRQAFVPLRLTDPPEPDFTERIINTVRSCGIQIDGLMTLCESYMHPVALACEVLGFPTQSPLPYSTATNKYKTSIFEGHQAFMGSSVKDALQVANKSELPYPMIIKPCNGWSSEGVSLVHNKSQIRGAIESIDTTRHGNAFVMESYCAGPEVDCNLVLLDGEILFFEVCDDMPKSADENGSGSLNTFIELNSVFPSALPRKEIEILRDSFHASLLRMGFTSGMFHLEGRVQDSTVEYRAVDGIVDLHPREAPAKKFSKTLTTDALARGTYHIENLPQPTGALTTDTFRNGYFPSSTATSGTHTPALSEPEEEVADVPPKAWLIEINPRPPGMKGTQIIESTWGIDYWAITLLTALRDDARIRCLAHPFASGPQYTCIMVFIPTDYDAATCEGVFDSDDIVAELFERRPDLQKNVSKSGCLVHRGQHIEHPATGHNSFLAYFNVFSRRGRAEAMRLADEVRREVRFQFK